MLAIANQLDLNLHQMDVKTVFLNMDLDKNNFFVEQPEGLLIKVTWIKFIDCEKVSKA